MISLIVLMTVKHVLKVYIKLCIQSINPLCSDLEDKLVATLSNKQIRFSKKLRFRV